jgi:hypothetical protein
MVVVGDDIHLASSEGCRSSDSTLAASDLTWKRQNVPKPWISEAYPVLGIKAATEVEGSMSKSNRDEILGSWPSPSPVAAFAGLTTTWFVGIMRNRRGTLGMLVVQDTRNMWRTPLINPR